MLFKTFLRACACPGVLEEGELLGFAIIPRRLQLVLLNHSWGEVTIGVQLLLVSVLNYLLQMLVGIASVVNIYVNDGVAALGGDGCPRHTHLDLLLLRIVATSGLKVLGVCWRLAFCDRLCLGFCFGLPQRFDWYWP